MLSDDLTSELTVKSAVGLDDDIVKRTKIKLGDKIAGWVALEGKPLFIENIENDPRFSQKSISQYTTKSLMSIPLKRDGRVIGVLNLNNKKSSEPFTSKDYDIASLLSEKISHFIELLHSDTVQEAEIQQFLHR
jgi:GAF domain-containing protein